MKGYSWCCRCGRRLSDPKSVEHGMGAVCYSKIADTSRPKQISLELYPKEDIILQRIDGKAIANVPHALVCHSPDGFEWGYGGSGPAELALNILAMFMTKEDAAIAHQAFKWAYIATMPEEGGVIKSADIINWIKKRR